MSDREVAVVTGGSRGIGKACALQFAKCGFDVVITYAGNDEAANSTINELKALGVNAEAKKFDIADANACADAVNEIKEKFGRIDILVNNAGITRDGLFIRMNKENWDAVINTNLTGMFNMTSPVSKIMVKQRIGSIVNLSSIVGVMGNAGQANYSAAKAGVIGFTKSLAKELASRNIRVNAIAPGFICTDMTKDLDVEKIKEFVPLKTLGEPDDVAQAVKFLAVDAKYVTGQVLGVDGGLVI